MSRSGMRRPSSGCPSPTLVADIEAGHHRGETLARFLHREHFGDEFAQDRRALARIAQHALRNRGAQNARRDRMALGADSVSSSDVRRYSLHHLRQLPSEIDRILDAEIEPLPSHRRVDVRGVSRQQDASLAIARRLTRRVAEAGYRGRRVHAEIGPVDRLQRAGEFVQLMALPWRADPAPRCTTPTVSPSSRKRHRMTAG